MEDQKLLKIINLVKLREFIRNPDLTPLEKCLFIDLLFYAGVDGEAFPSEETLAKDLDFSERHIRTQLKELYKKGWITGWYKRGYSVSNLYSLNQELYFRNEDDAKRKSSSDDLGSEVPLQTGSVVPPNINQEKNNINKSQTFSSFKNSSYKGNSNTEKPTFTPCSQDGCQNGFIFPEGENVVYPCECKEKFELDLKEWKQAAWGGQSW